ncbi:MAG: Lipopolysaccharide core heptosyltransferase RfaQ [Chlamydiae bacterium]|nr:Lipopolysaccharide core heptosyltransferase RfaQ [Chlamydiota bacterium]
MFQKILVIKLRHLGDVLLAAPVFTNLKASFPDSQIDAYIWKEAKPMLDGHPAISNFILHDRKWKEFSFFKRYWNELQLLRQIRAEGYDLVINLTEGDRGALAAFASGAIERVGVDPSGKWKRKIFTQLVKPCPNPRHTVERDLDALRKIGIYPRQQMRDLFFHVPDVATERAKQLVGDEPFVIIHAAARWRFKCLPKPLMAAVIDQLGERIVLTGAPSEREFVQEIADLATPEVLNLAGKTSLKEMGALMQMSKGMITVDSVALHMASALKVPVVALFGPTSEQNWGPWMHPRSTIITKKLSCRPCRLDGCGGSKMSDCLWTLSPQEIVGAFHAMASASALLVLNSFEMNLTE